MAMTGAEIDTFDRLATGYDRGMSPLETLWLREMRTRLLPHATGDVLEIGVGTGANFPFYRTPICVTAVDESADMLAVASERAATVGCACQLSQNDAECLSFPSGCFDSVVATLVLCSVGDQSRALSEFRRVLRWPGGSLLLLEHMRPWRQPFSGLADILNIPWFAFNGRCNLNRETQRAVERAGFRIERVHSKMGGLLRAIVARAR